MTRTSGKTSRRNAPVWAAEIMATCEEYDISTQLDARTKQAGRPHIIRMRERDDQGVAQGGTAVLTVYDSGSWVWGGDADAVAYTREQLERVGCLT